MRNSPSGSEPQCALLLKRRRSVTYRPRELAKDRAKGGAQASQTALIGLTLPSVMTMFNLSMIGVALPSIRSSFEAQADVMAWITTVYTLPYAIFMPLYGRLGDELGRRRLFLAGITIFMLGTVINLSADRLGMLLIGRAIQGAGAAGIVPLAIAMISELFPVAERGGALGTWNSIRPLANIGGALLAGLLIDALGWRAIFVPVLLAGLIALFAARVLVPGTRGIVRFRSIYTFDWGGVILLGTAMAMLLFYVSSKPITGVAPLRDGRLLAITLLLFLSFVLWERRLANPFVALEIFSHRSFAQASLCVAVRMFTMSGITFLMPLYLADVQGLGAVRTGLMLMIHAVALFPTMWLGGPLSDRWGSRWPVILGMSLQMGVMIYFALLGGTASLGLVTIGLVAHGLGAGLALPALHRAAMGGVPQRRIGVAAGVYSMIRFCGKMLGAAIGGVILQQGLDRGLLSVEAYQGCFWFIAAVALPGVIVALTLRE